MVSVNDQWLVFRSAVITLLRNKSGSAKDLCSRGQLLQYCSFIRTPLDVARRLQDLAGEGVIFCFPNQEEKDPEQVVYTLFQPIAGVESARTSLRA